MPRGNPVINIGLSSDVEQFIKQLKSELKTLGNIGVDVGLADSFKKEIHEIENMLDGLQKTIRSVMGTKLNSATFDKYQQQIGKQIDDLEKRTSALEHNMSVLINTMSSADGGKISTAFTEAKNSIKEMGEAALDTLNAVKQVQEVAQNNASINIIDASQEKKELEDLISLLNTLTKSLDSMPKVDAFSNNEDAIKRLSALYHEFDRLSGSIQEFEYKDIISNDELRSLTLIQTKLADIANEFLTIAYNSEEAFGEDFSNAKIDGLSIDNIRLEFEDTLGEMEESTRKSVERINQSLSSIDVSVQNATISDKSILRDENKGLSVPLNVRTTDKGLLTSCLQILHKVQSKLEDSPLEVNLELTTAWGSKKNKEILKEFQNQINSLSSQTDISEFQQLYDKVATSFGNQIELTIGSNIDVVEKQIQQSIARLKAGLKKEPLNIDLTFKVDDANRIQLQNLLTKITSDVVVTIKNVKFAKELNVKDSIKRDIDALPIEQFDRIAEKLEEIRRESTPIINTIVEVRDLLSSLPTDRLLSDIGELVRLLQVGFNALSISELDNMFADLQERVSKISGSLRGANLTEIKDVLRAYKEYQSLGGNKPIIDLSDQKNIQNWFKKHYEDQNILQNELTETAQDIDKINQTLTEQDFTILVEPLNEVIRLIRLQIDAYREVENVVSTSVSNEISDLFRLSSTLEEIANQIRSIGDIKGFSSSWIKDLKKVKADDLNGAANALQQMHKVLQNLDVSDNNFIVQIQGILSKGQELSNLAKILAESKKKIESASKTIQTQSDTSRKSADELARSQSKLTEHINNSIFKGNKYIGDGFGDKYTIQFQNQIKETLQKFEVLQQRLEQPLDAKGIEAATQEAKELANELENRIAKKSLPAMKKATEDSINKAILKLDKFMDANSAMGKQFRAEFENLRLQINTAESVEDLKALQSQVIQLESEVIRAGKSGTGAFERLDQRIKQMSTNFIAMHLSLYDVVRYIRTAAQTVTELDTALTELRKVSDASTERLNQSFETSAQTAQELGSSISDVINMTADWARLGYNVDQAEELARVTTLFQTVGDNMSADNASSYLISTLQGFQMATDQAEDIVDAYNEVANNFAIDTAGIGEALQRSAASFNAANTDLSESIALVTATNEVLQNPESVGTLWKTLSARIRGATTELQELGEEEDEYTKTTSKLRDLVQGLTGFDIMQDENNFKDIYEIILGIGKEWDRLTDVERASLGEALAGKRNSNALYAVLGNLDTLQEAYQKAESSAGSAAKEQENYAQSVQYSIDRNKASLQELARDFLSSDLLKTLLELANSLLQTLDKIVEKIGPEGVLGIAGAIVALFKGNQIKSAFDWISGLGDVFSKFGSGASLASQAVETAEAVSEIGEAAEESFWFIDELADGGTAISTIEVAAEGASGEVATLGGGISALSGALIALAAVAVVVGAALAWDHFTTTVEEAEEAVNDAKSKVIDLQSEIDELSQIENRTDGQEKRLRLLQDELDYQTKILETRQKTLAVEKYGNKFSDQFDFDNAYTQYGIDKSNRYDVDNEGNLVAEGTSAKNNIALLQKYIDLSKDADLSEKERNKNAQYAEKQTEKLKEKYDNYLSEIIDYESKLDEINQDIDSGLISPDGDEESKAAYERAIEAQKAYALWIAQDKSIIAEIEKALGTYDYVQDDIKQLASKWETGSISSEYIANELIDHMDGFTEAEKAAFYDAIKNAKSYAEVLDIIDGKQESINQHTSEGDIGIHWDRGSALTKYNIDSDAFEKYLNIFKELNPEIADNQVLLEQAAVANMAFDQSVEDLRSHLNDYVENLETLDESSVAYAESLQSLAQDLSGLTGIDFSITEAQNFASDINNLELLRQALDGDNEALNRLRENANQMIVARIEAQTDINVDGFNEQYNELVNWIAENPNIGSLEAQSYLDSSPFIQTCMDLIRQGKMTAQDLQKIFANLGWNITWDTKKMQVPKIMSKGVGAKKGEKVSTIYTNKGAQQVNWVDYSYELIDVPTNIRFEGRSSGNTAPKITKPTSSSGSNYKPSQKSGGGGGGGGSKDPTEEAKKDEEELEDTYDEFFDYFERRLKVVSDAISLLDAHLENVVGSNAKNTLLDAQMRIYKMQQQEYADAQNMYQEMADKALSKIEDSNIVEKIKNGAVGIDEFIGKGNEEVVNAINDYTKWADKVADCKQQLAELKETIRQLELTRMKNILQDWQDVFDLRQDNAIDLIDKQISLIEESGNLVGKAFYEQQKRQTEGQLSAMEQAKRELSAELNRGLANGSIEVGTDEWIEEVGLLQEVESSILDCKQAIEEYDNAILAIHTDTFDRLIDKFDDLDDELSDIAAFFDDEKVGDKFGNWSETGQAQAGLLAQQYELAQNKVKKYAEQIDWLNGQYNAGKYSTTEYTEQLAELMDAMRESAKDAESAKEAMLDLNKARVDIVIDGINEEIEAYSDLISKEKDALSAEKDLHDYRKQIAESNKSIVAIQKQLAAIENDNSQKARAQRAKLQQQLKDAQDALAEQEYDHSVEMQQQALDEQLEQYKDTRQKEIDELNAYVENSQQVLTDMFENVRANAESIGQTIVQTAQEHGFQVSTSLTESWKAGENAIASYGAVLTPATSEFIAQLENVEQQTWDLQDQADKTAVSLADMFGTRADTLVGELQRSWQAEANAQAMADALRQSMVYALESGYDISSVVSSLNSVANAAKDVADAANDAASALDNAISKQDTYNKMPKSSGNENVTITTLYNAPNTQATRNNATGKITQQSASDLAKKYKKKHARGLSKAEQDELAWTQELGDEIIISPTRNSILTPIKKNDGVLNAQDTANIFEWAKISPSEFFNRSQPQVNMPNITKANQTIVHFESLINVNGNVNDSMEMMKIAANEANNKLKETFRNINNGLRR